MTIDRINPYASGQIARLSNQKSQIDESPASIQEDLFSVEENRKEQELTNISVGEINAQMTNDSSGMYQKMKLHSEDMEAFKTVTDDIVSSDEEVTSDQMADLLSQLQETAAPIVTDSGLSETDLSSLEDDELKDLFNQVKSDLTDMKTMGPRPSGPPPAGPSPVSASQEDDEDDSTISSLEEWLESLDEDEDEDDTSIQSISDLIEALDSDEEEDEEEASAKSIQLNQVFANQLSQYLKQSQSSELKAPWMMDV